ncbi:DoxX family protein [Flavicella sp.]|uniref:DoxX family protein n=1 Tax=Flavicella sp. TaxID=2957742 RepID=UPI00301925BD
MKTQKDLGLLLIRFIIAGLMLFHGVAKLKGIDSIKGMLAEQGVPGVFAYGVYITEIIAPILILIGFRTRLASLTFFIGMLVIIFLKHFDNLFILTKTGAIRAELVLMYAIISLALFFTGGGKYAISTKNTWD